MTKFFDGTVVFGLNGKDSINAVMVYHKGAVLNDTDFRPHKWPNWGDDPKTVVRHHIIASHEGQLMTKSEVCQLMGIKNLKSSQRGHRKFKNTLIGDVLYITYDTNRENWLEAHRVGFIDKKCKIDMEMA